MRGKRVRAIAGAVLVALSLTACEFTGGGGDKSSTGGESFQEPGEIFLAAAADVGPDPFSTDPLQTPPDPTLAQAVTDPNATVTATGSSQVAANSGSKVGLYGGSMKIEVCQPKKLVDFLAANPDKGAAWVAALNADPMVKMADGTALTTARIGEYVASLTSVVLRDDTRVTNHLFKNGKAIPFQAVLQKGTAVLVDNKGVMRARCFCGNPLVPPVAQKTTPKYKGGKWADFDPGKITVVQTSTVVISTFILTDPKTGQLINRPAGGTGLTDVKNNGNTAPPTTASTTDPKWTITFTNPSVPWQSKASTHKDTGSPEMNFAPNVDSYIAGTSSLGLVIRDITGRRSYEEQLQKAQGDVAAFPAKECHETEQPVTLSGFTGVRVGLGPCDPYTDANGKQWGAADWIQAYYILKRPDGTTLLVVSTDTRGKPGIAEQYALGVISTVQKK